MKDGEGTVFTGVCLYWGTLPPGTEQLSEHLRRGGWYASCGHAGGLSCSYYLQLNSTRINEALKKNVKFKWSTDCENAFNLAKKRLAQDPMLYHPNPNKPWIIETDAS